MTYEEMQKLMDFIREVNARTDRKLRKLRAGRGAASLVQKRLDERWHDTENRIRALLRRAKRTERMVLRASTSSMSSRDTDIDWRLRRLTQLVERRTKEHRKNRP